MRHKPILAAMKHRMGSTLIGLREIPQEGRDFSFSRETGELNKSLQDLIGQNAYQVTFKITPMGNTFYLKGQVITSMDLPCALCAIEFKFPVHLNLNELLVIEKPLGKGEQMTRANHAHEWEAEGPDYIVLPSEVFNVAEYIHEMVALAEPIRPLGRPDCDKACENLKDRVQREWLTYGKDEESSVKSNPFQVLEKIKLKS